MSNSENVYARITDPRGDNFTQVWDSAWKQAMQQAMEEQMKAQIDLRERDAIAKVFTAAGGRNGALGADLQNALVGLSESAATAADLMTKLGKVMGQSGFGGQISDAMRAMAEGMAAGPTRATGNVYLVHCGPCLLDGTVRLSGVSGHESEAVDLSRDYRNSQLPRCPVCRTQLRKSDWLRVTFGSTDEPWPITSRKKAPKFPELRFTKAVLFGTGIVTLSEAGGHTMVQLFDGSDRECNDPLRMHTVDNVFDEVADTYGPPSVERCLAQLVSE